MTIALEGPHDAAAIEKLLDTSFGPKRHTKTVYRLRAGVPHAPDLSFVAHDDDAAFGRRLVASIRYWPILIGAGADATPSLLLGPIAVAQDLRGRGLGGALIRHSLARAADLGHRSVILVGDAPYYQRFGFSRSLTLGLSLPGPVDPDRFLGLELVAGALAGLTGRIGPMPAAPLVAAPEETVAHASRSLAEASVAMVTVGGRRRRSVR